MKKYEMSSTLSLEVRCVLNELALHPHSYGSSKELIEKARNKGIEETLIESAILFGLEQKASTWRLFASEHPKYSEKINAAADLYAGYMRELATKGLAAYEAALNIP